MQVHHALTVQTQLALPIIPFGVDTYARWMVLREQILWYQIPDLVVLLITFAFFCLSVMSAVTPRALPSDRELNETIELVRQRLLTWCIVSVSFAGGVSFFRAFDEMYPALELYNKNGLYLFLTVTFIIISGLFRIIRTYMSYI